MLKSLRSFALVAAMLLPFAAQAQTDCSSLTVPYTENFDGYTGNATGTTAPTGYPAITLPDCWSILNMSASTSTYPQAFLTSSSAYAVSGNCLFFKSSSTTPLFAVMPSMGAYTGPMQLAFQYRNQGVTAANGTLIVGVMTNPTDVSTFTAIETCERTTTKTLKEVIIPAGAGIYVAFKYEGGTSNNYYCAIDEVSLTQAPTCVKVTNLAIDDALTTTTSMTLTWVDAMNTGATYSVYNAADTTLIAGNVSGTSYTVTGLTENTPYSFAVLTNCGSGDLSDLTAPVSGHTACAAKSLPYVMGFEENDLQGNTNLLRLPWCASRYNTATSTTYNYYPYSNSSNAHSGSRQLQFTGGATATYPDTQMFILPQVDVTAFPMNANRVTFWARTSTATGNKFVEVGTMSDPTDPSTYTMAGTVAVTGNTYAKQQVLLTTAPATDAYVAILVPKSAANLYLDDLEIDPVPSCWEVSNVAFSDTTANSLTVTWEDDQNTGATYTILNGTEVVATGIGILGGAGATPTGTYTITGLDQNTVYTIGVVANCSATDASAVSTATVRTLSSGEPYTLPFTESFDASLASDYCWRGATGTTAADVFADTALTLTAPTQWLYSDGVSNGLEAGHYRVNIYGISCKKWMITPPIDLSTATAPQLTFDVAFTAYTATSNAPAAGYENNASQAFMVLVSTDGGATWLESNATKWQNEGGNYTLASIASSSYINQVIDLTPYVGDTIKIAFYAQSTTSGGDNNLHIDNISVAEPPSYCTPSPTSRDGQGITGVAFGGLNNTDARVTSAPYYTDFTAQSGSVPAGTAATVDITYATGYTYGTIIWVDWNKNYAFDGDEVVYVGTSTNSNPTTLNASFSIPATQAEGNYRMRIVAADMAFDSYTGSVADAAAADPCATYAWGVAEDYTLTVTAMPSCVPVTNLAVGNVTDNSITVTWEDAQNTGATYTVLNGTEVVATGVAVLGSAGGPVMGNYTFTGLTANTEYTFSVLANCSATEESNATHVTARTACASEVLPFSEDFSATLASDLCWRGATGTTAAEVFAGTALNLTAPTQWLYSDGVSNGLAAGHYRANIYGTTCKRWLITPGIDLSTATSAQLTFDVAFTAYSGDGAASGFDTNASQAFMVIVSTDGGATWLEANATKWQNEGGDHTLASIASSSYIGQVVNLNQYLGDTIKIAFYAQSTTYGGDNNLHIDNILVSEVPSCSPISNLAVSDVTETSITLTWDDLQNTGATYVVKQDGVQVATGLTAATYTATGLTANTEYTFTVQSVCSATDSASAVETTARTLCSAVTIPYVESFETDTRNCWTLVSMNTSNVGGTNGMGFVTSNDRAALRFSSYSSASNYNQYAFSPVINAEPGAAIDMTVRYATYGSSDQLAFGYSATASTNPDDYTWSTAFSTSGQSSQDTYTVTLPAGTQQVAIHYYGNYAYNAWVDSVMLVAHPIDTVTVATAAVVMGSVEPAGDTTVLRGESLTVTATPNEGYHFVAWLNGTDTASVENTYTFVVDGNATLTAHFAINTYTVNVAIADATMGSVSPAGETVVNHGVSFTATATALYGYHFVAWLAGTDTLATTDEYTFTVTSDTALTAVLAPNPYTVTLATADTSMGGVDPEGETELLYGDGFTATATPAEGYHFVAWLAGNDTVSTVETFTFTVERDTVLTAHFAINTYTVNVATADATMGSVSPEGETVLDYGTSFTATATANYGYHFVAWMAGDDTVSTDAAYTFTATESVSLTALFDTTLYHIEGVAQDASMGYVLGSGDYQEGTTVRLVAQANEGYLFVRWENGSTLPYYDITVTGDATVTAIFEAAPVGIDDMEVSEVEVYSVDNRIVVRGAEGGDIRVYDVAGRLVSRKASASASEEITVSATGVYLVRVGNAAAKRVAVVR